MAFITMNDKKLKRFEKDLKTYRDRAYPFATKQTMNDAAFQGRRESVKLLGKRLTLRNKFTVQSVRVEKTRTLNVKRQSAVLGSTQDYLKDTEFGRTRRATGKRGIPLQTSASSGEGFGARPRRRMPRRPNDRRFIKLGTRGKRGGRKQRNLIAIKQAVTTGRRFVFLDLQRHPGIYRVKGGKRNNRIELMVDMSQRSVSIPATPWLKPSVDIVRPRMPGIYKKALRAQLIRHRIFKP